MEMKLKPPAPPLEKLKRSPASRHEPHGEPKNYYLYIVGLYKSAANPTTAPPHPTPTKASETR